MQFQLPQNLITKVTEYDPALKQAARLANANGPHKSTRMSLGLPTSLFPTDFLTEAEQLTLVKGFNSMDDVDRATVIQTDKGCGLLVYKYSAWIAAWFFNEDHKKDYLYGLTCTHKATQATVERVSKEHNMTIRWVFNNEDPVKLFDRTTVTEIKYGRVAMIKHSIHITKDMVTDRFDRLLTDIIPISHGRKDRHKRRIVADWRNRFRLHLNAWEDESNLFARLMEDNDVRRCVFPRIDSTCEKSFFELLIDDAIEKNSFPYDSQNYQTAKRIRDLMQTPFFKKEGNQVFDETLALYRDKETTLCKTVRTPSRRFAARLSGLMSFLAIYPDASLDHCQQVYMLADNIKRIPVSGHKGVNQWLRDKMPVSSYIGILTKELAAAQTAWSENPGRRERDKDHWTGQPTVLLREFEDTISMLSQLYSAQYDACQPSQRLSDMPLNLEKPNRWRLTEFHDYLVGECFKLQTPNQKLHQDLFPQPVKVQLLDRKWTFFQPQDIHQLASWGRAVRNCVGSADTYRNGIKKKTHFIVLAMVDNVPRFTIQLTVKNGVLNVEQIADVCNRNLDSQEKQHYQAAFREALNILDQQTAETKS